MHLEPWQSWAIVGLGAAGAYIYYSRTGNKRRGRGHTPFISNLTKRRTSPHRGSSADVDTGSSGSRRKSQSAKGGNRVEASAADATTTSIPQTSNGKLKKRKGGKKESDQIAQSSAVDVAPPSVEEQEEDMDNREFANQMRGLKTGSSLARADGTRKQSRKGGKPAELPLNSFDALSPNPVGTSASKDPSNASSTTGADADDDLSPATSPPLDAAPIATSGGVDDMLEAPSKGPSVFRLTGVDEPKRQAKSQRPVQEPETKKQRQNRKKNEEKKLAREEAEKERKALLEKQLRTAREAEGRPARNGLAAAPAKNAWSKPSASSAASQQPPLVMNNEPPLDTFEDDATIAANGHSHQPQGSSTTDTKAWHNGVPSEEEQMRLLTEMDGSSGWNTVAKGGKSKKRPVASSKGDERQMSTAETSMAGMDDHSTSTSDDMVPQPTPSQSQTEDEIPMKGKTRKEDIDPKVWNRSNIHLHPDYDPAYPYALTGHPEDSDWAVV
ncbi:MAG: hypothetical protein Q9219_005611 [cf. Caloplaca sp. 3 TL-2023]